VTVLAVPILPARFAGMPAAPLLLPDACLKTLLVL
jgi:hypothetical protein